MSVDSVEYAHVEGGVEHCERLAIALVNSGLYLRCWSERSLHSTSGVLVIQQGFVVIRTF